ncbi:branched-chain amino acid transport system permease protein [Rhodoligotrophos appendicifer]|uniref:branched-chain amino acid ABC transporter permease n=1 Tax=Rhodoligotrophos appendicifer TaxID=987056 RepID=UPI001185B89D|nr:branched-chain amino acid ABC transporter permease [Rhodoligotrophos appendicifer]
MRIIPSASRNIILLSLLGLMLAGVWMALGVAFTLRMLVEASCYALLALGLTIQWGYAGLFNAGVMGFVALGGFMTVFLSFPRNEVFWNSVLAGKLGTVLLTAIAGVVLVFAASKLHRIGASKGFRTFVTLVVLALAYLAVMRGLEPVIADIEAGPGWIGGFGLPVAVGWIGGGAAAGLVGYWIGRICLGLRTDYLAIATLGIAEIIKSLLKNSDWLTRGTLTVSPLPWPVPTPNEIGFVSARAAYLCVTAAILVVVFALLQRAYHAPWGRMMRAIRDNEKAASAMGKDVDRRRLQIFTLGCIIMGVGGAAMASFVGIFDPGGFVPLNHTFLIWVMVILGGAGNNFGAIFGALFVYVIWMMSEPLALFLFGLARDLGHDWFGWVAPSDLDSRALQMRVFVIGLTITLVLRFAPRGLMPEPVRHES